MDIETTSYPTPIVALQHKFILDQNELEMMNSPEKRRFIPIDEFNKKYET